MDLKAKYWSDTCSDPIEYLNHLRQTTASIGGGTEYSEDGELVEYEVAIEAVKKTNDAFIEKACEWIKENLLKHTYVYEGEVGIGMAVFLKEFKQAMKEE